MISPSAYCPLAPWSGWPQLCTDRRVSETQIRTAHPVGPQSRQVRSSNVECCPFRRTEERCSLPFTVRQPDMAGKKKAEVSLVMAVSTEEEWDQLLQAQVGTEMKLFEVFQASD